MRRALLATAIVAAASLGCLAAADAQVVVPPGQDFYATPMATDGVSMPVGRIVAAAPAAKAKKRRARH